MSLASAMDDDDSIGRLARIATAFGVVCALTWFFVAVPREIGRASPVWLANAALLVMVLRSPGLQREILLAGFLGGVIGMLGAGDPPPVSLAFALANALQVAVAALGLRAWLREPFDPTQPRHLGVFIGLAIAASVLSAGLAATTLWALREPVLGGISVWILANTLGLVIVTPCLLILREARTHLREAPLTTQGVLALLLVACASAVIFGQSRIPLMFATPAVLAVAAGTMEVLGAAIAVILLTTVGLTLMAAGHGPVALLVSRPTERIILFQLYLAVSTTFALLVGALQLQRRRLSQALAAARDEAQAATAAKAEFLANVSHELRTPLTAILGFSSVLSDHAGFSPSARRYVDRIAGASRALLTSINDLLDYSRLEAIRIVRAPFRPLRQARAIMDVFAPEAEAKGLTVTVHGRDAPELVMADGERVRQVLFNLISNSVKFTAEGAVTVRVGYDAARATLSYAVVDTGPGIDPQDTERLFQRFTRFDGTGQGTGLGLAICKSVVEAMDGRIGMRPGSRGGSEFWFEIPAPRAEPSDGSDAAGDAANGLAGVRVLMVEDKADARDMVRALLEPLQVELTEARDGLAACAYAAEAPFDVILMNLGLPRLDAPRAALQIRSLRGPNQDTPIIACSAGNARERLSPKDRAVFDAYLEEPFSPERLRTTLAQWAH